MSAPSPEKGHVASKISDWSNDKHRSEMMKALEAEAAKQGIDLGGHVSFDLPFKDYVDGMWPCLSGQPFIWNRHNTVIADVLQDVIDGKKRRVMIWLPPRSGKSILVSNLLPGYYLSKFPERFVGLASYNQDQAETFSKPAKRAYSSFYKLAADSKAVGFWETGRGGGMWAAGVDSAQLGRGYSLGIIDDPIKIDQFTESQSKMDHLYHWYDGTFYTRRNLFGSAPAAIVIVQQRMSDYDLCGWLLSRPNPEPWHIVSFDAIKDEEGFDVPQNCTLEPDWRKPGEYLIDHPQFAEEFRNTVDYLKENAPFKYFALYQQRPTKGSGAKVLASDFQIVNQVPTLKRIVRAWDTQVAKTSRDFTVGVLMGMDEENKIYILDLIRTKKDAGDVYELIVNTALTDGPDVVIAIEEAAISKQTVQELKKETRLGLFQFKPIKVDSTKGNLEKRSMALFNKIKNNQVFLQEGAWNPQYVQEFVKFTGSKNDTDDQISATTIGMTATYSRRGTTVSPSTIPIYSPAWFQRQRELDAIDDYTGRGVW